ncbi:MAG: isoprenyl transferase [Coriobacteriia bacterium]|nr:isoprenyl transferase [Coriobacteriia bacterium]MBS5477620.1 isoprenyl transferase [Coriobacteriia bacterium]
MSFDRSAFDAYFADVPEGSRFSELDLTRMPAHIAVIMDGNGRWAKLRGKSRGVGHAAGVEALKEVITACVRLDVKALTVYAFSTENWTRPTDEVELLMALFASTLIDELPLLMREHVRLQYLGDMDELPDDTRETFERGLRETADNDGMVLAVAVNYGSRAEIARAARTLAQRVADGEMDVSGVTPEAIGRELYTWPLPDPELLIRTSGEYRLSNFLLWQLCYTEFVFSDVLWPDYGRWDLVDAIVDYQGRHRRFGGVEDDG